MLVLGIESSCDETAAAIVDEERRVLGSVIASQVEAHARFGGVVPDLAARMHCEAIGPIVNAVLAESGVALEALSAIAVTRSPGLIGCLLIGVAYAESLAYAINRPLYGVDHIEGHIYSAFMADKSLAPPLIALVVSGGHTALYRYDGLGRAKMLSRTVDDAAGEAFDKVGALLGLAYPGGPSIQQAAVGGNPRAYVYPRGDVKGKPLHFSFSGLKTAVLYSLKGQDAGREEGFREAFVLADVAASFQEAVADGLTRKTIRAMAQEGLNRLVVCGGVAANQALRERLRSEAADRGWTLVIPEPKLCTDNAIMIAGLGMARLLAGHAPDALGLEAQARSELSR